MRCWGPERKPMEDGWSGIKSSKCVLASSERSTEHQVNECLAANARRCLKMVAFPRRTDASFGAHIYFSPNTKEVVF